MPAESVYKKGMRVWIPHRKKVWESAIILEDYDSDKNKLFIHTDDSRQTQILNITSPAELPPLHLSEDSSLDIKSNLSSLSVIHEATILHKLRSRFEQHYNYNYCGISTIALNPYSQVSENENDKILNYRNSTLRKLDPHIFGVAEHVYTKLERDNCDQTLVFTGESGAGKSVNAERAILYLTTTSSKEDQVKDKILASSLILQAFGHASTNINDNSSRFGKFVQMQYDKNYHIIGALLTTYNCDRSSIVSQGLHRKAFNIFYYMYATKENLSHLQLNECQFDYLENKTEVEAYTAHNRKYFDKTIEAFNVLEFSEKEQHDILKILAVILHLQILTFKKIEGMKINKSTESCTIADQNQLQTIGKVLGLDEDALKIMRKWTCYKRTFCAQDEILQPMNLDQVMKARDALTKFVYTKLFGWLVTRMNTSFRSPCHVQSFIGILDMRGFEILDSNSFEQFCVNYIDEKVEQLFIQTNFKLEQEEYIREELDWTFIGFSDNMDNVELIEGKFGILDLLEEETKISSENILPWLENLRTKFEKSSNFETSAENIADFTIRHFIYPVKYNATDFLAKNFESVAKEQLEVLKESKNELLNKLVIDELSKMNVSKVKRMSIVKKRASFSSKPSRKTVTSELRTALAVLAVTLSKTKANFVRCIKSNDKKEPFTFDSQRVAKQLRAYNVVETIKLSAAGYFEQRCYKDFALRYHCLSQFEDVKSEDKQEVCQKTLVQYEKDNDVKFGKTKVFLHEDTVDYLENLRTEKRRNAAIVIQKSARRFLQQKRYNEMRGAICGFQPYARGYLVRELVQSVHDRLYLEHLAAIKIQACFRGFLQHRWYRYIQRKLPVPQEYAHQVEEHLGRFYSKDLAATEIQRHVKSFLVRRNYERTVKNIIIVQSLVRRFLAMLHLKKLKARNDLRCFVLNMSVEQNLDSLRRRIDCLMSMHLSSEDLLSVHSIMDVQTCAQAKNRILNDLLFRKIKTLQELRTNQNPCEIQQIQHTLPDSENCCANERCGVNWRMYGKPLVEQYDNESLYQNLIDSFRKVEKDAKVLQQNAGIRDEEIFSLMESYRNSVQAMKVAEVPVIEAVQEVNDRDTEVLEESIQITEDHCTDLPQSSSQRLRIPDLSLDTEDLLDHYSLARAINQRKAEERYDLDEECKQRYIKKAHQLKKFFDEDEPSEETSTPDVDSQYLNRQYSSPKSSNQQKSVAHFSRRLHVDRKINFLNENKNVLLKMYGDENEFEEASNADTRYVGMFVFELRATETLIHHLTDVSPSIFIQYDLSPDLPVQILMMCIRYADHRDDYLAALSILCNFIKRVRQVVEIHELLHISVFWLLNTHRLLNYLKQYSKKEDKSHQFDQYHVQNTARQNQHRLINIDLRDTWATLEQTCRHLVNLIVKEMNSNNLAEHSLTSLLDTDEMYDLNVEVGVKGTTRKIDILLDELTNYYELLIKYGIDRQVIIQIFKQIFNYINSLTLSNILSRRDLCSVFKGIRIRGNLRILERWATIRELSPAIQELSPVIQAVRLIVLQPISQDDILNIHENYTKLNWDQILKIINLYNTQCFTTNPSSYRRKSVPLPVIDLLRIEIQQRQNLDDTVLVDAEERPEEHQIQFPFRHSRVKLEQVEIPQRFYLPMLKKI